MKNRKEIPVLQDVDIERDTTSGGIISPDYKKRLRKKRNYAWGIFVGLCFIVAAVIMIFGL